MGKCGVDTMTQRVRRQILWRSFKFTARI